MLVVAYLVLHEGALNALCVTDCTSCAALILIYTAVCMQSYRWGRSDMKTTCQQRQPASAARTAQANGLSLTVTVTAR
jgi:hypothetical protein